MRKLLNGATVFILFTVTILVLMSVSQGCKQALALQPDGEAQATETKTETPDTETVTESTPDKTQDLSEEVETKFGELGKTVANIGEIFSFIDDNIEDANQELASEMVYTVMKLCGEYKLNFTDKFNDQEVQSTINSMLTSFEQIDLNTLLETDNRNVKELVLETIDKKYKLMSVEGFIMPLVDYKAYDIYRPYLTQEMNDYMDIKLDESEKPSVLDAGIVIPIDDFIDRIIKSMDYIKNYPDSLRADEVEQFNNGRIYMYLSGIDNNPVFDSNGNILPDRLTEFESNLTKYGDTEFGKILGSYLDLLEQEGYVRTQEVDDFLSGLF
jgi:hypothetical protein